MVPINTLAKRDGPSHHPCQVLEFLLISVNLIGENVILLFYICTALTTSDVGHLFHMFRSRLHFSFWELSKWVLKPPNTKLFNRKPHRKPAPGFCCHGASAGVFEVCVEQPSIIPSHLPYFD